FLYLYFSSRIPHFHRNSYYLIYTGLYISFFFHSIRRFLMFSLFPYTTLFRSDAGRHLGRDARGDEEQDRRGNHHRRPRLGRRSRDRKSTRLNSSHVEISYAVFCLKKKK